MTVNYKSFEKTFCANDILIQTKPLVNQLVTEALVSTTETYLDAAVDCQDSDPAGVTSSGILHILNGQTVKAAALEYLMDMLGDLQLVIKQRMAQIEYRPVLNAIKYSNDGEVSDIVVTVNVVDMPTPLTNSTLADRSTSPTSRTIAMVEDLFQRLD